MMSSPCAVCKNRQDTLIGYWCRRICAVLPACGLRECIEWEADK